MGCFTCNCLKNEGINLTNDVFDVYLVNPLLKRFIIKLQSNWRRFKFKNDFIKVSYRLGFLDKFLLALLLNLKLFLLFVKVLLHDIVLESEK